MSSAAHPGLAPIADALRRAGRIVVCGHVSPDGDCIGSTLALSWALRALGKTTYCLLASGDEAPYALRGLPGAEELIPAAGFDAEFDLFACVDVPNAERMGKEAAAIFAAAPATCAIDHHEGSHDAFPLVCTDPSMPATTMLVWELAALLGVPRDERIAACCYAGLFTDTGGFRFQNTTAGAFTAAAEMVAAGARPADVARDVCQSRSRASLGLELRVLSSMTLSYGGQLAIGRLSAADFADLGAVREDAEPLIDVLRSMRGVRVACMLREQEENVRGSLRAKDDTDVESVARALGGGGHRAAAGFTFAGSLDDAQSAVLDAFSGFKAE